LAKQEAAGLTRRLRPRSGGSDLHTSLGGRPAVVFSSNDYLGLAADHRVRQATAAAALAEGMGATGSPLLSGYHEQTKALEAELCDFEDSPSATVISSGYQANVAVLQALGGPDAAIFSDQLNHASIIDACRLSRSQVEIYAHRDLDHLEAKLKTCAKRPVIVSDTVFSMDGVLADVGGLASLADRHGAWLMLDEAHATGVTGPGGLGAAAQAGIADADNLVRVITFSKALGAQGAAVVGGKEVRQLLLQRGRALIFSTGLALPSVAGARAALAILAAEPERVARVANHARHLRQALAPLDIPGEPGIPIVPVVTGDAERATLLDAALLDAGFLVQAVRPPSVPPGASRIRMTPTAAHTEAELDAVAEAVHRCWERLSYSQ
jgi:8-amino-7-oxononanoate synthase